MPAAPRSQVWGDCQAAGVPPDSRMCITFMEICTRLGKIDSALQMYSQVGWTLVREVSWALWPPLT